MKDIPRHRNPVVLVRCVVRPRDLSSSDAPRWSKDANGFNFYNTNGDELFSNVENETNLAEQELVDEESSRSDGVTSSNLSMLHQDNLNHNPEHPFLL